MNSNLAPSVGDTMPPLLCDQTVIWPLRGVNGEITGPRTLARAESMPRGPFGPCASCLMARPLNT